MFSTISFSVISATALLALASLLQAAEGTPSPTNAHLRYTTQGRGVQIYRCTAQAGTFQWTFEAPEATLTDTASNKQVGTHSAGPTWTWNDHSAVTGKLLQKTPSPDPNSIPWLLLEAQSTGSRGALSDIKFVRRSNTKGGNAPTSGCDAQHQNATTRVPYEATYTFYTAD